MMHKVPSTNRADHYLLTERRLGCAKQKHKIPYLSSARWVRRCDKTDGAPRPGVSPLFIYHTCHAPPLNWEHQIRSDQIR